MFQMMQQVYSDDALSHSVVFRWHQRFSQGGDSLEDNERIGRPQTVLIQRKIDEVAMLVRQPLPIGRQTSSEQQ